jgi:hypothetical protein
LYTKESIPVNKGKMMNGRLIPDAFKYQRALRWDFEFRTNLLEKIWKEDNNVNGNCLRALTSEFINFSDGIKTIEEIARAAGYEYEVKLNPEHVLEFFLKVVEKDQITLKNTS